MTMIFSRARRVGRNLKTLLDKKLGFAIPSAPLLDRSVFMNLDMVLELASLDGDTRHRFPSNGERILRSRTGSNSPMENRYES